MSELRTNLLSNAAGTGPAGLFKQSAAKAFTYINGTGTVAIRASLNVSSIVDEAVGQYSSNLTNAMADTSYVMAATSWIISVTSVSQVAVPSTTTKYSYYHLSGGAYADVGNLSTIAHGDLA
jgi:hypothetical protein